MKDRYRKFYERVGRFYPEDAITYSTLSGLLRKKWILSKIQEMPPGNLLDCGCNVGRLSARWHKGNAFGIDISFAVLQRGKDLFPEVHFIHGDLRNIAFIKSQSIDNAIACEVVEHLDKPLDFLNGLYKIMKQGGLILITTPCYTYVRPKNIPLGVLKSFGVHEGTEAECDNLYLHTAYKPEELGKLAKQAGFEVVEDGYFEFELRGWLKPLAILANIFEFISARYFPYSKLNQLFTYYIERLKINLFLILETFSLSEFLKSLFKEGKRAYIIVRR